MGELYCPRCGHRSADECKAGNAFLEIGIFDGKSYEAEGSAQGFKCSVCAYEFWVRGPAFSRRPPCFGREDYSDKCESCPAASHCRVAFHEKAV